MSTQAFDFGQPQGVIDSADGATEIRRITSVVNYPKPDAPPAQPNQFIRVIVFYCLAGVISAREEYQFWLSAEGWRVNKFRYDTSVPVEDLVYGLIP